MTCNNRRNSVRELRQLYKRQRLRVKRVSAKCIEKARDHRDQELEKFEGHIDREIMEDARGRITASTGIELSENPYKARIQKIAAVLIMMCKCLKFLLLGVVAYQILVIGFAIFDYEPKWINTFDIFIGSMRGMSELPFISSLSSANQIMIRHFVMILVAAGLLWVLRLMYGLLLNVATNGNPFTKGAVRTLHTACIPLLLLMIWNIPISIFLVLFILFISFIFDYGIYISSKAEDTLRIQEDVILSFAEITEAKSGQTGQHVKRVSEYTRLIAEEMGMSHEKVEELRIASMMHDVGKLLIPSDILDKPGKLTNEEFAIIKKHTEYGEQLLLNARGDIMHTARVVAKEHHEKWDGNGYHHMKGEEISIEGRIVAVADVYDALTSKRSYKDAWAEDAAYEEIVNCSGSHFDPEVVEAFKDCYDRIKEVHQIYADVSIGA